jgi:hypothetical protein
MSPVPVPRFPAPICYILARPTKTCDLLATQSKSRVYIARASPSGALLEPPPGDATTHKRQHISASARRCDHMNIRGEARWCRHRTRHTLWTPMQRQSGDGASPTLSRVLVAAVSRDLGKQKDQLIVFI